MEIKRYRHVQRESEICSNILWEQGLLFARCIVAASYTRVTFFQKNFLRRCCSSFSLNACLEKSNKIISLFLQKEILWNRKTVFCQENCDKAKQTVRVLAMSKKSGTRQSILRMFRFFIKNETTLCWISFFVKFSFAAFHDALLGQKLFLFLLSFNFEGILSYSPFSIQKICSSIVWKNAACAAFSMLIFCWKQ